MQCYNQTAFTAWKKFITFFSKIMKGMNNVDYYVSTFLSMYPFVSNRLDQIQKGMIYFILRVKSYQKKKKKEMVLVPIFFV